MERIDQRAFGLTIKWSDRAPDIDQDEYRQELTIRILENATKDPAHLAQSYGMILQRATWQLGDYVLRKREYRRANFAASFDLDEPATSEPDGPTMAETMITDGMALFRQWHTRADLVLALEDIPHRARQATILAKIAGYRIKDLAPMLDVGPATVSRDIRDATRTLRNDPRLADYNQTPTHKRLITVADLCADTPAGQWSDLQLDTWTIYNGRRILARRMDRAD
jgi:DNA-directed RNA polymerase specialized sigma24 family protein